MFRRCTRSRLETICAHFSKTGKRIFLTTYVDIYINIRNTSVAAKITDQCTVIFFATRLHGNWNRSCASYISIIFPTENRSDGCRSPREMAKYAWHNLKANVQGEGLPSWPDTDVPPIPRNPTPTIYFDRRDCELYEFARFASFPNNNGLIHCMGTRSSFIPIK